jgi:hypothetical protein
VQYLSSRFLTPMYSPLRQPTLDRISSVLTNWCSVKRDVHCLARYISPDSFLLLTLCLTRRVTSPATQTSQTRFKHMTTPHLRQTHIYPCVRTSRSRLLVSRSHSAHNLHWPFVHLTKDRRPPLAWHTPPIQLPNRV